MAQIKDILDEEARNEGAFIRLYAEGIFYKAYERSAWTACRVLHPFMVKKRAVRKVGQEVLSIGFPKTSLTKWAGGRRIEALGDDFVLIHLPDEERVPFDEQEFTAWKSGIALSEGENVTEQPKQEQPAQTSVEVDICQSIRRFPIENKSPMDCMLFVSELKSRLASS